MRRMKLPILLSVAALMFGASAAFPEDAPKYDTGLIPSPRIATPDDEPNSVVFLISDKTGWSSSYDALSEKLVSAGAVVVGIDLPTYLASIAKDDGDCTYLVSDIEGISHQTLRATGASAYHPPIVAGIGEGAALALQIAAQTPPSTISQTVAVDPTLTVPMTKTLCTPADKRTTPDGIVYGLTEGALPNPISVILTAAADAPGAAHVTDLRSAGFALDVSPSSDDAQTVLSDTLAAMVAKAAATGGQPELPIVELPAKPAHDTMAIVYSGDGGWRDIDKTLADVFQKNGVPTIGMDSLHYFWSEKTPDQTALDLEHLIETYTELWQVKHVLLVGYSFGADIMPAAYNALKPADKAKVSQISLLGFSANASYEISVSGWLGAAAEGASTSVSAAGDIDPGLLQCFYGEDEDETACPRLEAKGIETIKLSGGHHFDGDYASLATTILNGLAKRQTVKSGQNP